MARKPSGDPPAGVSRTAGATPAKRRVPKLVGAIAGAAKSPGTPRKKAVAAGPQATTPAATRTSTETDRLDQVQQVIVGSLEDDKAEQIVTLDLIGRASFADRMVIATGLADRQISAMAAHLSEKLHEVGIRRVQVEGASGSDWVLIDAGDIVVHLFKAEARETYGLERMWGTAALDDV